MGWDGSLASHRQAPMGAGGCCNSLSLAQVELEGLTGHIEFNSKGQRSNYALKVLQFTKNGFRQVKPPSAGPWPLLSPGLSGWDTSQSHGLLP